MSKPYISSIEKTDRGSYIVDYWSGSAYRFMEFLYYTKRQALQKARERLGIKRNPLPIRDYAVQPRRPLIAGLVDLLIWGVIPSGESPKN